ncbi:DUF1513 domain-containing protein [uncultured Sulfitobacter sp.]|uniref:DUF1513 domain-containing protein n=1 Tax=uncultured Sulfitobacter sp. TaxID=191468 RepID=UPI0026379B1A|nr:DUF1513 domain-containing protein [uncultured Sulfitobacter sp.]
MAGLLAIGVVPVPTWADAGTPAYLSAAATSDGSYILCGLSGTLDILFRIPLPARGHAAAAHPIRPEAVAFARRPGTFAIVIDCVSGKEKARLNAPQGRHFYGHGAFSLRGNWLFTTENDYEAGRGRVGVWDVVAGYRRVAEFDSGGIGPHDIKRLPNSETLVIANGGIDTHPDTGRTKLNLATMQSNLTYIEDGTCMETAVLTADHQKNSMRHLAVNTAGDVAIGMQWQGDGSAPALVACHRRGGDIVHATIPDDMLRALDGYIGSIAYAQDGASIGVTSPRGNIVDRYHADDMSLTARSTITDVCGIAASAKSFAITTGWGALGFCNNSHPSMGKATDLAWDNHLIVV